MPHRLCLCSLLLLLTAGVHAASDPGALASAEKKVSLFLNHPDLGPRVVPFSAAELVELGMTIFDSEVPGVITEPRLRLSAGAATATMYIDFGRLDRVAASPLSLLLRGPRLVTISVEIKSARGTMRVHPTEVRIGDAALTGSALDYAITNILLPYYPDAIVNRDFALPASINRIQVTPAQVLVYRN